MAWDSGRACLLFQLVPSLGIIKWNFWSRVLIDEIFVSTLRELILFGPRWPVEMRRNNR